MSIKENVPEQNWVSTNSSNSNWSSLVLPLQMDFQPKEDITTWELAQCLKHTQRPTLPHELDDVDIENSYLRHFKITNPNKN